MTQTRSPSEAARDADVLATGRVGPSMGQESEA